MKHCLCLIGNSSSGIIEAASFQKFVINIGNRQKGRACSKNVFHCSSSSQIIDAYNKITKNQHFTGKNVYGNGDSSKKIVNILKNFNNV